MKKSFNLTYKWNDEPIKESHREALEESAIDRIFTMVKQGYTGGELIDNILMDDDDPEDGIDYHGWWSMREEHE